MYPATAKFCVINVLFLFFLYESSVAIQPDCDDFSALDDKPSYFPLQDSSEANTGNGYLSSEYDDLEYLDAFDELTPETSAQNITDEINTGDNLEEVNATDEETSESALTNIETNADADVLDIRKVFNCTAPHLGLLKCIIRPNILQYPTLHHKYIPNFKENKGAMSIPTLHPSGNAPHFDTKVNESLYSWIEKTKGIYKKSFVQ